MEQTQLTNLVVFLIIALLLATVGYFWRTNIRVGKELERFRRLADEAHDLIWIIDRDGRFLFISSSVRAMLGFEPEELLGKPLDRITSLGSTTAAYNEISYILAHNALRYSRTELKYRRRDGGSLWVELTINLQRDPKGKIVAFYGIARDIDEQHQMRQQMYHQAHHDPLTNLPNRILFFDRLRAALSRARRQGWQIAVLYMDLDDFKHINDNMGHDAGDQVLRVVGERLAESMRAEDTIARIGGDEFAAVIDHVENEQTVQTIVNKLAQVVCEPIHGSYGISTLGVSIGYVLVKQDDPDNELEVDPEKLLARADRNMYVHKRRGKEGIKG